MVVDACSIMNFAAVNRMPLFETAMRGRGRWTQAVEGEIRRYANTLEFQHLSALLRGRWLGEAIELDSDADRVAVEDVRAALGGVPSEPLRHLGEAETIRAIESRPDLRGAIFLTDDGDARYLATHRGITVKNTRWLVADAHSMGDILCPEPYQILKMMWEANRPIVLPESHKEICP
jgi:predicted nucleic acid-binding protein